MSWSRIDGKTFDPSNQAYFAILVSIEGMAPLVHSLSLMQQADIKAILEAHGAPSKIRIGVNNFTPSIEYVVHALIAMPRDGDWFLLRCRYMDAEGQEQEQHFGQARVRNGKVMVRFPRGGNGWKTAVALEKQGSDYAPALRKIQSALETLMAQRTTNAGIDTGILRK